MVFGIVAAGCGSQTKQSGGSGTKVTETGPSITHKVTGTFGRLYVIDQAGLEKYIKTRQVWCATQGDKVLVHVTIKNTSSEHVTVNWNPSYSIVRGGVHGDGLSAVQSDGFDSGETRSLTSEQDPKGAAGSVRVRTCSPHFQMIESG